MNKRKLLLAACLSAAVTLPTFAGGILTNSNQSIAFMRQFARGAVIDVDGVYFNPAGLAFMNDGFHLSFNWQNAYQERNINAAFPLFPEGERFYKGKASAPFIPSLYGVYKKDKLALSGFFGVVGGGGKASFDIGLPMFDTAVMGGIASNPLIQGIQQLAGIQRATDLYNMSSAMDGRQYIFGLQVGASYQFADWFSGYVGARMNYFTGGYEGYVKATVDPNTVSTLMANPAIQAYMEANPAMAQQVGQMVNNPLVDMRLDLTQTGWGINPVIGADFKFGKLNLGLKYEFKANLNIENDTKENTDPDGALAAFKDGVNTPSDVPSLFAAAAQYEILPKLRVSAEYHWYDDKHAGMANHKEKALKHGTHEVLAGVEWDINKTFTVGMGGQNTDYGLADDFQSDTAFSCDSYSIGFGGSARLSSKLKLNVGYFWTTYKDYDKSSALGNLPLNSTYSRSNKVFGAGIDYTF
ncbi:MAG: hypothetical protein Q4D30_08410 [Bacteroidales bacterium]|nr:hypothetical protein [Bacteroidales bacterium]